MQEPLNPRSAKSSWALLVDGSALFFGQRAVSPDKNMNYMALKEHLERQSRTDTSPMPALFFTAGDEGNEKQVKFHELIKTGLGWHVHQIPPHEATIANALLDDPNNRTIRFDAMIAYALGRLSASRSVKTVSQADSNSGNPAIDQVFVISDSWPLAGPIRDCVSRGTAVTVAFFGSFIDTRWHKTFREAEKSDQKLTFIDLDTIAQRLFDRSRPSKKSGEEILPGLP